MPVETKNSLAEKKQPVKSVFGSPSSSLKDYPCSSACVSPQGVFSDFVKVRLSKCCCGSAWCPSCFKRFTLKKIVERLGSFDWEAVRHIVLTVDRSLFKDGQEAYEAVKEKEGINRMVRELRRSVGTKVVDWVWILEWHKGGWPHWHLFLESGWQGKQGMIGGDILRKYWRYGKYVHESPIESSLHWLGILDYFGEHGYFGTEKGIQNKLPEWALDRGAKIRRWGAMVLPMVDEEKKARGPKMFSRQQGFRTYRVILKDCGSKSFIKIKSDVWEKSGVVEVPYRELRNELRGNYIIGVGYVVEVDWGELLLMGDRWPGLLPFVGGFVDEEEFMLGVLNHSREGGENYVCSNTGRS